MDGWSTAVGKGVDIVVIVDPQAPHTARTLPLDQADYEDPSWAPDGRHISPLVLTYRSAIYLLDTQEDPPIALLAGREIGFSCLYRLIGATMRFINDYYLFQALFLPFAIRAVAHQPG